MAALQIVVASVDWLLASLVLYVLLAPLGVGVGTLVRVFVLAQVLGLASHVPGGFGVFESVVVAGAPTRCLARVAAARARRVSRDLLCRCRSRPPPLASRPTS